MIETELESIVRCLNALDAKVNKLMQMMESKQESQYISMEDASKVTGLAVKTLGDYCRKRLIESTKMGRHLVIVRQSLYDYINTNARKTIREQVSKTLTNINS